LGEQSAIEALERFLRSDPTAEALLLFEDTDVEKRRAIVDVRVSLLSTGDFLRELEEAGLIESTDHILDQADGSDPLGMLIKHSFRWEIMASLADKIVFVNLALGSGWNGLDRQIIERVREPYFDQIAL
jgi:hypothetical protein